MAGAALRGLGKALLKKTRSKYIKKIPRGTPTKAAFIARRNQLRGIKGETTAEKYKKLLGPTPKGEKAPKIPSIKKTTKDVGKGAIIAGVAYAAGKSSAKKEAKAKEDKEKLKKALEKKKAEDEKKKKAYGKRAPKKDKNYGGR